MKLLPNIMNTKFFQPNEHDTSITINIIKYIYIICEYKIVKSIDVH
jgi:hypothetical protein